MFRFMSLSFFAYHYIYHFVLEYLHMNKTTTSVIIAIIIIAIIGIFVYTRTPVKIIPEGEGSNPTATISPSASATSTQNQLQMNGAGSVIGVSVGGRDIVAYHYGTGAKEILFVGGIHGGYEWNTVLVAGQLMNYLKANPSAIPSGVRVTVIPVMNPDGLNKVVGTSSINFTEANVSTKEATVISGRFNGATVDLNRNFDCDWKATGKWQSTSVSGGSAAFSEPESQAIKSYVASNSPSAVVVWYSAAGGVFASNCHNGVLPETSTIAKAFANASDYPYSENFDFYATTGDMTNWLAKMSIPAFSVLLTNHTSIEWSKNLAGVQALFNYYK